ncbi:hypothetical protein CCHR01_02359 [Colletotrichum chrysophilum]|uniref:Secreted protein n=1 Tax=Colletotrichum chrysophilum TaxID=1836956 RepID=A0AAD9EKF2_9PEZI|nr:hypothetical protein CCHR01_02359 [Colletotrichum chrysophilum]
MLVRFVCPHHLILMLVPRALGLWFWPEIRIAPGISSSSPACSAALLGPLGDPIKPHHHRPVIPAGPEIPGRRTSGTEAMSVTFMGPLSKASRVEL